MPHQLDRKFMIANNLRFVPLIGYVKYREATSLLRSVINETKDEYMDPVEDAPQDISEKALKQWRHHLMVKRVNYVNLKLPGAVFKRVDPYSPVLDEDAVTVKRQCIDGDDVEAVIRHRKNEWAAMNKNKKGKNDLIKCIRKRSFQRFEKQEWQKHLAKIFAERKAKEAQKETLNKEANGGKKAPNKSVKTKSEAKSATYYKVGNEAPKKYVQRKHEAPKRDVQRKHEAPKITYAKAANDGIHNFKRSVEPKPVVQQIAYKKAAHTEMEASFQPHARQPNIGQPHLNQPFYGQSHLYSQPMYAQPMYAQHMHSQPMYYYSPGIIYNQPIYVQPPLGQGTFYNVVQFT